MGRKRKTPARVAANLRAARSLGEKTREQIALEKAAAQLETAKLKAAAKLLKADTDAQIRAKRDAERQAVKAAKNAGPAPIAVQVQPPQPDPERAIVSIHNPYQIEGALAPDHLTTTRMTSDGKIHHDLVLGRDGMPVPAVPTSAPAVDKPAPVTPGRVTCGPNGEGVLPPWFGRQPTREELKAAHEGRNIRKYGKEEVWIDYVGMDLVDVTHEVKGFLNPGGIVQGNIDAGHDASGSVLGGYCRVAGRWPGGRR